MSRWSSMTCPNVETIQREVNRLHEEDSERRRGMDSSD